ncbi:hypothetical protein DFJ77DRAFT_437502 [Powellomyces hirtus]|nr:hypothetical protein DFJ77DRAFT_437502 [Powellomyces hirtus]
MPAGADEAMLMIKRNKSVNTSFVSGPLLLALTGKSMVGRCPPQKGSIDGSAPLSNGLDDGLDSSSCAVTRRLTCSLFLRHFFPSKNQRSFDSAKESRHEKILSNAMRLHGPTIKTSQNFSSVLHLLTPTLVEASANQLSKLTQKRLGSPMTSTEPKLAKLTAEPVCKENPPSSLPRTVGQADELSDTTAEATNPALSPFPGMVGQVDKLCSQEFGAVIDQTNKHRANKADHMTLFWGALDLRPRGPGIMRNDNDRAQDLLDAPNLSKVKAHYKRFLPKQMEICPQILPLDLDTLAETNELRGCEGVISLLESRLADLLETHPGQCANVSDTNTETYPGTVGQADTINECESHDAEERGRQCVVAALLEKVRAICPQDPHVRYICRKLSFWVDKQASQPLTDSTERTVDVFEVLHFTKLPSGIKLRYGDGSSSADTSDKLLRNSNTRVGKKVDYLLKRLAVLAHRRAGMPLKDIAATEGIPISTVSDIIRRFHAQGTAADKQRSGRPQHTGTGTLWIGQRLFGWTKHHGSLDERAAFASGAALGSVFTKTVFRETLHVDVRSCFEAVSLATVSALCMQRRMQQVSSAKGGSIDY